MREWYKCEPEYQAKENEIVVETTNGDKLILMDVEVDADVYGMSYIVSKAPAETWDLDTYHP